MDLNFETRVQGIFDYAQDYVFEKQVKDLKKIFEYYKPFKFYDRRVLPVNISFSEVYDIIAGEYQDTHIFDNGCIIPLLDGVIILQVMSRVSGSSIIAKVFSPHPKDGKIIFSNLESIFEDYNFPNSYVDFRWFFLNERDEVDSISSSRVMPDIIIPEAYPFIHSDLSQFIEKYITGDENILFLQGPPGTGKTRLIREIVSRLHMTMDNNDFDSEIAFVNDSMVLSKEAFYLQFIFGESCALVLDDSDANVKSRQKHRNDSLNKILFASDGIIPHNKKIIISTNLEIDDIDQAVLRPGRCFSFVKTRELYPEEIKSFIDAYNKKFKKSVSINTTNETMALSDIYKEIKNTAE